MTVPLGRHKIERDKKGAQKIGFNERMNNR